MGLDYVQKKGITVTRADYDLIYTAPLTEKDTLDGIYGRKTHFIPNGVNRPQIREASLITDKFGLKKGSCQCHEPSCLIPICTKNSPSPCGNGEHKSYIIFSVYLTECTSQLNRWFSGGLRLTQTQPYIIPV